ncbi:signal transduction histidine kinase/tetratricopeptide (TPR) repeat protein [Flavobacterium arsenatis]|uniref:Signal transduction histidine kinase/tetratricopeptide (TPR) repeat protein n=1 Tax=Flavobacterium arsenatis TaxID=1484332 RepID=A0ABU1TTV1_9FLAO|nr:ATP-binding protein [Flavobacterium arsenatis]MDR6969301.1 signal transduction histidine kinase/tetratricopeptide (TPR) repeat protein [Flavobacterium arsenatis]
MKFNSPFFYLLLLVLFFSCTDKYNSDKHESSSEKQINSYLDSLVADTVDVHKMHLAQKALNLAKQTNDKSYQYKAILYKMDYVIASTFPDSIPIYLDMLLEIAPKTEKENAYTAYVLTRKADYIFGLKDYQKAYDYYNRSNEILKKENDSLRLGYNLLKMAEVQQIYNDYVGSEETITEALVLLENIQYPSAEYLREAYNKLGISYTGLRDYSEAIKYYSKAKELTDDPVSQKMIENNIGLCYLEKKEYGQAIKIFTVLYKEEPVKSDPLTLAKVADNLGYSLFQNDGNSGRKLMEEALSIRTQHADKKGLTYSYLNLAHYYGSSNPALALDYAQKAYSTATSLGATDHRLKALQLLATYGEKHYQDHYFQLNDSIDNFRQQGKNHFAKLRFDATKERNENLENKLQQKEDRIRNLLVAFILIGFIILVITLYFRDKRRHKKEKQKQKQEDEYRTEIRIAKKLHDELANDIFNTMTFAEIRNLATPENKEILLENLDKIYAQTRNISKENNTIDTAEKYKSHLKDMLSGYGSEEVNIILKEIDSIEWMDIEAAKKIVVYRVLQELLVNMKKHSKATLVLISFKKTNKKIQINYSDNGVGIGSHEHLRKNGLQNVENRIQSINGTITFDPTPKKGFKVNFSFNA